MNKVIDPILKTVFFSKAKRQQSSKIKSVSTLSSFFARNDDFGTRVETGYLKNPLGYRCVQLIARSLSTVPLTLWNGDEKIEQHALLALLAKPNPLQNYTAFCEAFVTYLLLSGNSFLQIVAHEDALELYVLRPDHMKIETDDQGFPWRYVYGQGPTKQVLNWDLDTGLCPIMHMKLFNPLDANWGLSPLSAAFSTLDLQNTIVNHNLAILRNAGSPSGALIIKGARLTPAQHDQLNQELARMKGKGVGNTLLLDGDFEWKDFGLSPKEMDFSTGKNLAARDIAQIFGIPPMCVGILGDSTFSNYQEARLHLWEDTLLPLLDSVLAHLNQWLVPLFGADLRLAYHKDHIAALIPRQEKVWKNIMQMDCLTLNEQRKLLGYSPVTGGDVIHRKKNIRIAPEEGNHPLKNNNEDFHVASLS